MGTLSSSCAGSTRGSRIHIPPNYLLCTQFGKEWCTFVYIANCYGEIKFVKTTIIIQPIIEIHQLPCCGNSSNEFANLDVYTNIEGGNVENIAYSLHIFLDLLNGSMRPVLFVLYSAGSPKRHGHSQNLANARGRWRTTHCHSLSPLPPLPITATHCHHCQSLPPLSQLSPLPITTIAFIHKTAITVDNIATLVIIPSIHRMLSLFLSHIHTLRSHIAYGKYWLIPEDFFFFYPWSIVGHMPWIPLSITNLSIRHGFSVHQSFILPYAVPNNDISTQGILENLNL